MKLLFTFLCTLICLAPAVAQIKNFDAKGRQAIRFSTAGDAVDAHDGEIAHFNGTYYLYGTSYDCGFQWGNKGAPFCGFKVYSSTDLSTWTDRGYLFDAKTSVWQSRCDGKTYGCFRPHVIYNQKTKLYVLWINVYDNVVGYRVFTAKTPIGPFTEVAEPHLAVNSDMPAAGLNNGDHDTFIDDDGTAYLAYTDWRKKGSIVIEKLTADYLSGTGEHVASVSGEQTEAPGLFKRRGIYYVVYSDPNCGYCSGTGTSYRTAKSPLGPWSDAVKISDNSCGGQPSFVSTIKINAETVYLYGSDLWNNAAKNEALANYYWAPLTFTADGAINPLECLETYKLPKKVKSPVPANLDNSTGSDDFSKQCDIAASLQRAQSFTATKSGLLSKLSFTAFKNNNPDKELVVSVYATNGNSQPTGEALYSETIADQSIGWSAKNIYVKPNLKVKKGTKYVIILKSAATTGCYGVTLSDLTNFTGGSALTSSDNGKTFKADEHGVLKFETFVKSGK
ncbi:family 43 glycosylhydrolase [Mucilaginibacter gynuensis]